MISFLQLLPFCRHKRFEKAFLLAVDIGAKDLFMVRHFVTIFIIFVNQPINCMILNIIFLMQIL